MDVVIQRVPFSEHPDIKDDFLRALAIDDQEGFQSAASLRTALQAKNLTVHAQMEVTLDHFYPNTLHMRVFREEAPLTPDTLDRILTAATVQVGYNKETLRVSPTAGLANTFNIHLLTAKNPQH